MIPPPVRKASPLVGALQGARGALLGMVLAAGLCPRACPAADLLEEDVDGDGRPELILRNEYLRVVVDGGQARPGDGDRYGLRFPSGGWIRELSWRPSHHEFFSLDYREGGQAPFTGLPEEFEQPVVLERGTGDAPRDLLLKVGIGTVRAERVEDGNWRDFELVEGARWTVQRIEREDGGRALLFEQSFSAGEAAYVYRKRIVLDPGASSLRVERELRNTGSLPLHTTWYPHPCYAPGKGNEVGPAARAIVPLDVSERPGDVDTRPCPVLPPDPYLVWGGLPGRVPAEPWMAAGEAVGEHLLATSWGEASDWFRVWTTTHCFALEPFLVIDLAPGAARPWTVRHQAVQGMDGLSAVRDGLLLKLEREADRLRLEVRPDRAREDLRAQGYVRDPES